MSRKRNEKSGARKVKDAREFRFVRAVIDFMNSIQPHVHVSKMMGVSADEVRAFEKLREELDVFAPVEGA